MGVDLVKAGRALVILAAVLVGAAPACGDPDEGPDGSPGSAAGSSAALRPEAISFGEALAQIRGHHRVSLELYREGDKNGAALHAGHPIAEILASVQGELSEAGSGVSGDLEAALEAGAEAIASDASPEKLEALYVKAAELTQTALTDVVGPDATDGAYRASVIASLLATSGHEYEEAVGGQGIRLLAEYQDGYAFIREARALYDEISAEVTEASDVEAAEIDDAFEQLETYLPSPTPPKEIAEVLDVESASELIGHELEETLGAVPVQESDPAEVVAEIERLLDEILETYEAGDADAAAELAAEAYLENYEVIEAGVIRAAPEVNEELEPLLGAELRRQITEGASVEDITSMVARAKDLLGQALDALEGAEH